MKRFSTYPRLFHFIIAALALLLTTAPTIASAQIQKLIEIDESTFRPINTDPISGLPIDKIDRDPSQRACARIKMHISRMTAEEIAGLSVRIIGGNAALTKQIVAKGDAGLIIEMTAKQPVRFFLHHDKLGDSNEVSLNLEGDKEYRIEAQLKLNHSIVISSNTAEAEVSIDGQFKGRIDKDFLLAINDVPPGIHIVKLQYGTLVKEEKINVNSESISFRIDINHETARPQYVVFQVKPTNAIITIDNKEYTTNQYGDLTVLLNNGSYSYTVSAQEYHDDKGSFIVNGSKVAKSIELRPAFGWVKIPAQGNLRDASVYIDNKFIGQVPVESDKLASGVHEIRIVKNMYLTHKSSITVEDNKTLDYAPTLVADFAHVTLSTGDISGCEIYINNELKGTNSWSGDLATGAYIFEARKASHRTTTVTKNITATPANQSYILQAPTPILGTLDVRSTPAMADIYIDGKKIGDQTPTMLDLLVGKHKVTIRKDGFSDYSQEVTISEGKIIDINAALGEISDYVEQAGVGLNMKMIFVEGGTFRMGATEEQGSDVHSDERPVHSVTLDSYYIAECEVTQAQWRAIMGNNPSHHSGDSRPVENISWNEAQAFCQKLSEITGRKYTLPTEAQWEYAARGGNKSKSYKYSGSNYLDSVAWYKENSNDETHNVKQKLANELGLYDMSGNVWEWCSDIFGSYSSSSQINPNGSSNGNNRVERGVGYNCNANGCRVSYRNSCSPSDKYNNLGLRVVCVQNKTPQAVRPLQHNQNQTVFTQSEPPRAQVVPAIERVERAPATHVEDFIDANNPFVQVEQMPSFQEGDLMTFRSWVMDRVRMPQYAIDNNISGRVIVSFIINKSGKLVNIKVLQTPDASLSNEVIRVLTLSPMWAPGRQRGEAVSVKYTLPIHFAPQGVSSVR